MLLNKRIQFFGDGRLEVGNVMALNTTISLDNILIKSSDIFWENGSVFWIGLPLS
jgi:hypothetical protein